MLSPTFRRSVQSTAKSLITGISKVLGETQLAFLHTPHLFDEKPQRNLISLGTLLSSNLRNNDPFTTWALFQHIHTTRTDLDSHTFTPILRACSALPNSKRGVQVHALMIKLGCDIEIIPKTAILDMYSKYGLLDESVRVFGEMGSKDLVAWNALLSSFLRNGKPEKALAAFEGMKSKRVEFNEFTLCSLLKSCSHLKALRQGMQIHGLIVTMGRDMVVLATALIDFYSDFEMIGNAIRVYGSLNSEKDLVLQNSFIAACVKNKKYNEAFSIMSSMKPNVVALTSAVSACSEKSDLLIGKKIHCVAIKFWLTDDTQLSNALVRMYAKSGKIFLARSVFDGILHKDVISWTSMIDAYGIHGNGFEAVELFTLMEKDESGVLPNDATLLAVLSACAHSGLVEQGRECFNSIKGKYGLIPSLDHYTCFIDILGRAGLIDDVWCLYHEMIKTGIKPTVAVWAALLNACGQNNDVSRGEFAAKQLTDLVPDDPSKSVLVSNFYATIGKWDFVDQLRLEMKNKGLFKAAGSSWFTVSEGSENVPSKFVNVDS